VGGTKNLLDAAKRAGVSQFIYTSTVATIAVDRPEHPNESTEARLEEMVGHYKRSKWQAERIVLDAAKQGFPSIVAMPTTPVGPWDWKPTPTGKIILDFLNGKMPGYVETGLNFVGVEECAAGHLLISDKGKIGERYLLGGENLTLKEVLDLLAKITGLAAPKLKIPHGLALGVAYANTAFSRLLGREPGLPVEGVKIATHTMFDNATRAQKELGFQPGPVAAALERAVRCYVDNGYVLPRRATTIPSAKAACKAHPSHLRGRSRIRTLAQASQIYAAKRCGPGPLESYNLQLRYFCSFDRYRGTFRLEFHGFVDALCDCG